MKRLLIITITMLLFTACPAEYYERLDALLKIDSTPPVLLSFELSDNRLLSFRFSEPCTMTDINAGGLFVKHADHLTEHHLCELFTEIPAGEEQVLKLTVEDRSGNTSRYWTRITGINLDVPLTLITEVSSAGTQTSPDRIELTFLSSGTTDGLCITDGAIGEEKHRFYLPSLEVRKNDCVVIWWDREPRDTDPVMRDMNTTWILYAGAEETLSSTNGSVILYSETNGEGTVMDALLWNRSDATLADGFGNIRSRNTFFKMEKKSEWTGSTVHSDKITSSRVFSRYWPYEDTNGSSDWYISAARMSTFGWPNNNREFIEEN